MAVIYRITNMANGKYYIGSAESFARREWQHKYALRRKEHKNPRLQAAWDKYGEEMFVFEIVEDIPLGANTLEYEDAWLRTCVGQPDCYNVNVLATAPRLGMRLSAETKALVSTGVQAALAEGRGGHFIPTAETRKKMSDSLKGNKCALGYKRTAEEKEAIRQRTLGNKQWLGKHHKEESKDKLRRGIVAVAPDGTRQEFTGTKLAGEALGLPYQMIVRLCKSGKPARSGKFAGWQFFHADEEAKPVEIPEEYKDVPRTRETAKATGATHYFTGVPCTRGHIALRKTKGCCVECQKEDWKKG